jgi:subtilisin-like proprotein convertase family protein
MALKAGLSFSLLLCCFSWQGELQAQCNPAICSPDNCPPTVNCVPNFTANLNTSGTYPLVPTALVTSVTDNCTTPTLSVAPSSLNCSHVAVSPVTVVVTAKDVAGNMSSCSISVTVVDPLPPSIVCPVDITVDCATPNATNPSNTGFATADDNCGILVGPIIIGDTPIPAPGGGCSALERTWWAMDVNGLTNFCVQIITVKDDVKPEIDWNGATAGTGTPPADVTIECDDPLPAAASFGATDNCSTPTIGTSLSSTQGSNPAQCSYYEYMVTRTYSATDACGNVTTYNQKITVEDNEAPAFTGPATVTKPANANCQYTFAPGGELAVSALDACAGAWPVTPPGISNLTTSFAVVRNIDGVTVNSGPGLDAAGTYNAGIYTITYSAKDPCNNLDFHQITLNITDNVGPVALCQLATIQVSLPPTGTVTITPAMVDNGSYDQCSAIVMSVSPNTMTCANLGLPLLDAVILTVTDANGNSNTCTAFINVVDNSAPAMLCKNVTVYLDATGQITVPATDIDNGTYDACGLGAFEISKDGGVTYGPSTTFLCPEIGPNAVLLKVTDAFGNMGTCPATVTVVDDINPIAVCAPATVVLNQDGMYTINLNQFTVPETNSTPVLIPDSGPATSTVSFAGTGVITDVNITNLDVSHNRIGDLSFTLTSPSGTVVTLGNRPGVPTTILGCLDDDILVSFDDAAPGPKEAFENSCNGTPPAIQGAFQPIDPLSAFNGEDLNGVWTLTVTDNTGFLTTTGSINTWTLEISYQRFNDLTIGYGSDDNCSFDMSISPNMFTCADINKDGNPATGPGGNEGVTYTLTVTDHSGNTATCSSTITVIDNMAPMITCGNLTVSLNASGNYTLQPKEVLTGGIYVSSGNNGSSSPGETRFCVTMPKPMTLAFDWEYLSNNSSPFWDPFGVLVIRNNVSTFTQLSDNAGPLSQTGTHSLSLIQNDKFCFVAKTVDNIAGKSETWIKNLRKITLAGAIVPSEINDPALWMQMGSFNTDGKAFFYDACGPFTMSVTPNMYTCANVATPTVYTVTVTDKNGNSSQCSGTVTVQDKQPPQAQCDEVVVNLDGDGNATVPAEDFDQGSTDGCCTLPGQLDFMASLDGGLTFYSDLNLTCANIGADQMVVLKVSDCAMPPNDAFCMTMLTVNDKLPPMFTMCPDDITLECDEFTGDTPDPSISGIAMAEDNCDGMITPDLIVPEIFMPAGITTCPTTQRAAYLTSSGCGEPWGVSNNTNAMDAVFGAPNWDAIAFEGPIPVNLFTYDYDVIFLEGSDCGANELNAFLQANMFAIEDWVAAGGSLFLNAAPNEGGDIHFGFGGVVLKGMPYYLNVSYEGNVAVPTHPIFTGATLSPAFTPAAGNFTGNYFSHAVICPPGMAATALILTNLSNTPPALVEMDWGFGKVMFGGMTTTNWHLPFVNADNMRRNLLSYLNGRSNCGKMTSTFFNRDCRKITRRWSATDSRGNTSLCFQDIVVEDNTYPTLIFPDVSMSFPNGVFPADVTVECDDIPTPPVVTVNDNCAADHPATLREFNSTRGNDPNDCSYYSYSFQRFWTGVDNCGNTVTSAAQTITVQDTEEPEFTNAPLKPVVSNAPGLCEAFIPAGGVLDMSSYISDNCADNAYLDFSFCVYQDNPPTTLLYCGNGADATGLFDVGIYTIEYYADDPCGNVGVHTLILKVKDTESPSPNCIALSKPLTNNGTLKIDPSDIDHGDSDDNCGIKSLTLNKSDYDCSNVGVNTVILTAMDEAGNMNACTTTLTITLPTQPGIICQNNITVNCNQSLIPSPAGPTTPAQVVVAGPCNGLIVPDYKDVPTMGTQPNCRTIQRTWTAAGATCVQIITVVDPQAPVFASATLPATADCSAVPAAPNRTANDDCLGALNIQPVVTNNQGPNPALCSYYEYTIGWSWTATDNCNPPVTVNHTVSITDDNGPVLTIADPFVYPLDNNACQATVVLNLLDYLSDCAADQYLTVTNTITNQANGQPVANGNGTTNINGVYLPGLYTVNVTATDPCGNTTIDNFTLHVKDLQSPEAHCKNSTVTLDNTGNADLTVTQVDNMSDDNCGAVTLSFAAPPAATVSTIYFNTGDIGPNVVTLYVTDGTGNTGSCQAIVTVTDDPTFIAGDAVGAPGEMKLVPVSVMQYQDITSFQIKFTINTSVASFVDVIPVHPSLTGGFVYTTPVPPNMVTVGWVQPLPQTGADVNDGDILFNLKVMISNAAVPGNSTPVDIDQATLEVEQLVSGIPTTVSGVGVDGSVTVVDMTTSRTVSGSLRTMPDPNPGWPVPGPDPCAPTYSVLIPGVNVAYSGTLSGNIPGAPGTYSLVVPNGANETFTPSKNNPTFFGNPVTAYDAFRVQHYAVGNDPPPMDPNPPLAPLQVVAADANSDNVVTQSDASLIQELSAKATSIPKNWRFIPELVALSLPAYPFVPGFNEFLTYNNITADISDANFIGVRVGNVFGCEDPTLFASTYADERGEQMMLRIEEMPIVAGEEIEVVFKAKDFTEWVTGQYTLNFNPHVLAYVEAVPNALAANSTGLIFNSTRADEGMLAVSWFNQTPVTLADGQPLYTLKFKALQNAGSLKDILSVSNDYIIVEAVKSGGTFHGVSLIFEGVTTATNEQQKGNFALYQNTPNPFGYRTAIGFSLPERTTATLTITDAGGKVLKVIEGDFKAGYHQVFIERKDLATNGVLFYRLDTPTHTAVKKMVLVD